jgi:uncharacterized protein (DUF1015 family)
MVKITPFKSFYPVSLTDFALPMIHSDIHISKDVKSIDDDSLLKIPANIKTNDTKRIFQEILTLGHSRKYEALSRHWTTYESLGFFKEEPDSLFVYRMEFEIQGIRYQQTGLICLLELDRKTILGHENILRNKLFDQLRRLESTRTSISPVYLLYKDSESNRLNEYLEKITFSFPIIDLISSNDVRHTIWKIQDESITSKIIELFDSQKNVFIADGHHRIESAHIFREDSKKHNLNHNGSELYNFVLSAIFPLSQSHVLEYNRIVKNVKKFKKDIIPKIKENFYIEETSFFEKPNENHSFVLYRKKIFYLVKPKSELLDKHKNNIVENLDTFLIQEYIFKGIFHIKNVSDSNKIIYFAGTNSLEHITAITEHENGLAFILHPIKISDIVKIAENHQFVPPKSTWFEPKLLKGMMFWKF